MPELTLEQIMEAVDKAIPAALQKYMPAPPPPATPDAKLSPKEFAAKWFMAAIKGGSDDPVIQKALSEGTDSAGGYLVPDEFRAEVITSADELSELAQYVTRIPVRRHTGKIPSLATDVTVTWDDTENNDFTESNPVFSRVTWDVHRLNAICTMSRELLDDNAVDLSAYLNRLFSRAVVAERDKMIAIGNGTTQPYGIYSASITQSVSVGTITFAKLVDIETALPKKYRAGARWIMNNTNEGRCKKVLDDYGRPIFVRDPALAGAATILGYPMSQQNDLPNTTILFGNLGYWYLFDREQLGIETTSTGGDSFKKHQFWIKVWERYDGKLVLVDAFSKGVSISG